MKPLKLSPISLAIALLSIPSALSAQPSSPPFAEDEEYHASGGLDLINAAEAYRRGYTGKGVVIGIHDEPSNYSNPEFNLKNPNLTYQAFWPNIRVTIKDTSTESSTQFLHPWSGNNVDPETRKRLEPDYTYSYRDWELFGHGTHVSGIAAASRNGVGMQGVAYDAEVIGSSFEPLDLLLSLDPQTESMTYSQTLEGEYLLNHFDKPNLKVINMSWGLPTYNWDSLSLFNEYRQDDLSWLRENASSFASIVEKDKLLVILTHNFGKTAPSLNTSLGWLDDNLFVPDANQQPNYSALYNNVLSVSALNNIALERKGDTMKIKQQSDHSPLPNIIGTPILTAFSNGQKYADDMAIAAPGHFILSADADYAFNHHIDKKLSGTSMSTPFVTGAGGVVQQAFPYFTGKQIGDTLLSTANQHIDIKNGDESYLAKLDDSVGSSISLEYLDPNVTTNKNKAELFIAAITQWVSLGETYELTKVAKNLNHALGEDYLRTIIEDLKKFQTEKDFSLKDAIQQNLQAFTQTIAQDENINETLVNIPIRAYYRVPLSQLVGAGVLDVGKAVLGPASLNARRMDPNDRFDVDDMIEKVLRMDTVTSRKHLTQNALHAPEMVYRVDTQGQDSTWYNDVNEIREGRIAPDSAQADMRQRYQYYATNWLDYTLLDSNNQPIQKDGHPVSGLNYLQAFIKSLGKTDISQLTLEDWNALDSQLIQDLRVTDIADPLYRATETIISEAYNTQEMVNKYNRYVSLYQMDNLPVGLYKSGKGTLTLAGHNTYLGSTIAADGVLHITGSIAGGAFSTKGGLRGNSGDHLGGIIDAQGTEGGIISGTGTIEGPLVNNYLVVGGDFSGNGILKADTFFNTPNGTLLFYVNDIKNEEGQVTGEKYGKLSINRGALLLDAKVSLVIQQPTPYSYTVLEAKEIIGGASYIDNFNFAFQKAQLIQEPQALKVAFTQTNNLDHPTANQREMVGALHSLYNSLSRAEQLQQLRHIYQMNPTQGQRFTKDLAASSINAMLVNAQYRSDIAHSILSRSQSGLRKALWADVSTDWFDDGKHLKGRHQGLRIGADFAVSPSWRLGGLVSYTEGRLNHTTASDKSHDWRLGAYALYRHHRHSADVYVDYGRISHDTKHSIRDLNLSATGKPTGYLWEVGGEYRYRLWENRSSSTASHAWENSLSPYINIQASHYKQGSYTEKGAGIFARTIGRMHNNYVGTEMGLAFQQQSEQGGFGIRVGYKHILAGYNPSLDVSFAKNPNYTANIRHTKKARHLITASVQGSHQFNKGLSVKGQFGLQMGKKELQMGGAVSLQYQF